MLITNVNFTIKINSGDAAMVDTPAAEISRILREVADRIEGRGDVDGEGRVFDYNGNRAGDWWLEMDEES